MHSAIQLWQISLGKKKQQVAHIKSLPFIVYLLSVLISNVLCPRSLAVSRALTAACWNKQAGKQTLSYYEKNLQFHIIILVQMYRHCKKKNSLISLQRAVININFLHICMSLISSFLVHISVYAENKDTHRISPLKYLRVAKENKPFTTTKYCVYKTSRGYTACSAWFSNHLNQTQTQEGDWWPIF